MRQRALLQKRKEAQREGKRTSKKGKEKYGGSRAIINSNHGDPYRKPVDIRFLRHDTAASATGIRQCEQTNRSSRPTRLVTCANLDLEDFLSRDKGRRVMEEQYWRTCKNLPVNTESVTPFTQHYFRNGRREG